MKKTFKLLLMLIIPIAMVNCDLDENIVDTFGEEDPFAGGGDAPNPCTGDVLGSGGITHTHLTTAYGTLFSSGTANHGGYWSVQGYPLMQWQSLQRVVTGLMVVSG